MAKKNANTIVMEKTESTSAPALTISDDILKAVATALETATKGIVALNKLTDSSKKATVDAAAQKVRAAIRDLNKAVAARDIEAWRIVAQKDINDFWTRFISKPCVASYALKWDKEAEQWGLSQGLRRVSYSDIDPTGKFVTNRAFYTALAYVNGRVLRFIGGQEDTRLTFLKEDKMTSTRYNSETVMECATKCSSAIPESDRALPWVKADPSKDDIKTLLNRVLVYMLPEGMCAPLRNSDVREILNRMVKYDRDLKASVNQRKPQYSVELLNALVFAIDHRMNNKAYEVTVR